MIADREKQELQELNRESARKIPQKFVSALFEEFGINSADGTRGPNEKAAVAAKNEIAEELEAQELIKAYQKSFADVQETDRAEMKGFRSGNQSSAERMVNVRKWFVEKHKDLYSHVKEQMKAKLDFLADGKDGIKELVLFKDKYRNRYVYDIPVPGPVNNLSARRTLARAMGLETEYGEGREMLREAKQDIRQVVFRPGEYLEEVGFILSPLHEKMEAKAMEYTRMLERDPHALDARIAELERIAKGRDASRPDRTAERASKRQGTEIE